jgi:hypothetical protein
MTVICKAGRTLICAHKRNLDPNLITCAIDATNEKCTFAQDAREYMAHLEKLTGVKP